MPNIVYVLTNPAMPGIVKIGRTDSDDVQVRMRSLYTTGVPLPFECVIARELEGVDADLFESALHSAFGPSRVSPSREFFQIDPEQVEPLLRAMPGRDVTPGDTQQAAELEPEDIEASAIYKRRQARTNEDEFMASLSKSGTRVYEGVLAMGRQEGMHISWGSKGFTLNVVSDGSNVAVCYGYPPSAFNQRLWTGFTTISKKTNVPPGVIESLKEEARSTGLWVPAGRVGEISCETDRQWQESELEALFGWLESLVRTIRQYENTDPASEQP